MSDLDLDLDELEQLAGDLTKILTEFESATGTADAVADATGEDDLRGKVRDFARNWDITREKMVGNIETLQANVQGIVDNFRAVDADLEKALEEDSSASNPAAPKAV